MQTTAFKRNGRITKAMPVVAGIALFCGILYADKGDWEIAALWLLMTAIWVFNYFWSSRNPFLVLSDDGLTLRPSPLAPAKEIAWHMIMHAQRSGPSRLTFYLVNGRKFSIYLTWIDAKQRQPMVQMVQQGIAEKGAAAQ